MKHHKRTRTLGREKGQRKALLKSLAVALVTRHSIQTTEAKAKELRPFIEKLVTHAKKGTLASHRDSISSLGVKAGEKLFGVIAPLFKDRKGGYTRVIKMERRKQDGASMAIVEFVEKIK